MEILNQCKIYTLNQFYKPCMIEWQEIDDASRQISRTNTKQYTKNTKIIKCNNNGSVHVSLQSLIDNNYASLVLEQIIRSIEYAVAVDYDDFKQEQRDDNGTESPTSVVENIENNNKHVVILILDISSSWNITGNHQQQQQQHNVNIKNGITIIRQIFETPIMGELSHLLNFLNNTVLNISKFQQYLKKNFNIPSYYQLGAIIIDNLSYYTMGSYKIKPVNFTFPNLYLNPLAINKKTGEEQHHYNNNNTSSTSMIHTNELVDDMLDDFLKMIKILYKIRKQYGALTVTVSFENKHF